MPFFDNAEEVYQYVGKLFEDLGVPALDAEHDRVMICGSPGMLRDLKHMLEGRGFKEGNTSTPGAFVIDTRKSAGIALTASAAAAVTASTEAFTESPAAFTTLP